MLKNRMCVSWKSFVLLLLLHAGLHGLAAAHKCQHQGNSFSGQGPGSSLGPFYDKKLSICSVPPSLSLFSLSLSFSLTGALSLSLGN